MDNWRCVLGYILAKAKEGLREFVGVGVIYCALVAAALLVGYGIKFLAELSGVSCKVIVAGLFSILGIFVMVYNFVELIREAKEHCE